MGLVRAGIAVFLTALALAPAAQAAQRYAAPEGKGPEPCVQAAPCSLKVAINKAKAKDEVIIGGGTYTTTETIFPEGTATNLFVHGDFAGAPPQINGSTTALVMYTAGSRLAYVYVSTTGTGSSGVSCSEEVTLERIHASGSGEYASGIAASGACKVRDSVALATGTNSRA